MLGTACTLAGFALAARMTGAGMPGETRNGVVPETFEDSPLPRSPSSPTWSSRMPSPVLDSPMAEWRKTVAICTAAAYGLSARTHECTRMSAGVLKNHAQLVMLMHRPWSRTACLPTLASLRLRERIVVYNGAVQVSEVHDRRLLAALNCSLGPLQSLRNVDRQAVCTHGQRVVRCKMTMLRTRLPAPGQSRCH